MEKDTVTPRCKVLLIGGSAGSLEVLIKILPRLTAIPTFAIVIIVHRKSSEDSTLEELIAAKTTLPVKDVEDKVVLEPGNIYVAPSDYHLLFEKNNLLSLDTSEKVNYSRPSIDVSFESAADAFGPEVAAILLSGANSDGTHGLAEIREAGGIVVIQDPESAEIPFMPRNALENVAANYILDVEGILRYIQSL
ncbi:chemotaxis protein CheB [Flavobacterium zepuense]|uniref:protein-glutamate methylesterase n=1 Tax=Flavobacterium zepuense TaxID=2593302 RepID=A0A552VA22_9FLAO|nr:chemotaxis protein CheB [Flavobacterium zepuense]TRW27323.1 chemotaxis protein CheB [Flavobacterium zepuense]